MDETKRAGLEDRRQLEHLAPLGFAFLLPYLPYGAIIALALLAVVHALVFSPRLIRVTTRADEALRGFSPGKLYYALSVLALLIIFRDRIYIAAGIWAVLAVGDSLSNIIGRRFGKRKLPYNSEKSEAGLLAFLLFGGLACWILMLWNGASAAQPAPVLLGFAMITALASGVAESLPPVIDDNLALCWTGTVVLGLLFAAPSLVPQYAEPLWQALAVNSGVAIATLLLRWLSLKACVMALLGGTLVFTATGLGGYLVIFTFLVLGSITTRLGWRRKKKLGVAEAHSGTRGLASVLANGCVPLVMAVFYLWNPGPLLAAAFAGSVATAAFDTVSTEIGQWLGRSPFSLKTFRMVPVGTQGAVSLEGSLAGVVGAGIVASVAVLTGWLPLWGLAVITLAGWAGAFYESFLAAWFDYDFPLSDEVLNLYSTLFGACVAGGLAWLVL